MNTINNFRHEDHGNFEKPTLEKVILILKNLRSARLGDKPLAIDQLKNLEKGSTIDLLKNFLADPDPEIRMAVTEAMATIGIYQTMEYLLQMLHDENEDVRWAVCYWLGSDGDERAIEPLINTLLHDQDPDVRAQAALALGASGDDRAIPVLTSAIENDFEVGVQNHSVSDVALTALRTLRDLKK